MGGVGSSTRIFAVSLTSDVNETANILVLDPTYPKPKTLVAIDLSELIVPVKHKVVLEGSDDLIVYLAPDDAAFKSFDTKKTMQRVFNLEQKTYTYFPNDLVELITRRRLASWPTDRRRCDSPVMLRLLEEIRAANRR